MKVDLTFPLNGLELHAHPTLQPDEAFVMDDRLYVDAIAYRMIERGDPIEEVMKGHSIKVIPAMGSGWPVEFEAKGPYENDDSNNGQILTE